MSTESIGQDSPQAVLDPVERVLAPYQAETRSPATENVVKYDKEVFEDESPSQASIKLAEPTKVYKFGDALTAILQRGFAMRRQSWPAAGDVAYIGDDGFLKIFRGGREFAFFQVHETDIMGEDWLVFAFTRTLTVAPA